MIPVLAIVAVFVLIVVSRSIIVVPRDSVYVVERLGVFHAALSEGMHVLVPFTDRIAHRHSTLPRSEQLTDHAISRDNVPLSITSSFRWQIDDPRRAAYGAASVVELMTGVVRSQQRDWIARHSAADVRETTRQLEADVTRTANEAAASTGVRVIDLTVQRVDRA